MVKWKPVYTFEKFSTVRLRVSVKDVSRCSILKARYSAIRCESFLQSSSIWSTKDNLWSILAHNSFCESFLPQFRWHLIWLNMCQSFFKPFNGCQHYLSLCSFDNDLVNHTNLTPTKIADLLNFVKFFKFRSKHISNTAGRFMNNKTEQLWEALFPLS